MYSDSSHGLVPWELLRGLLVSWDPGNSTLKCLPRLTEVQVGVYSDSSHGLVRQELGMYSDCSDGLVPWELLS